MSEHAVDRQLVSEGAIKPLDLTPEETIEPPPSLTSSGGGSDIGRIRTDGRQGT